MKRQKTVVQDHCAQEVLARGTQLLWWIATSAVAVVIGFGIKSLVKKRYEPPLNIIVAGIAAGYLPWFFFQKRTVFSFYAIVFETFLIIAIIYCAYVALLHFENKRILYTIFGIIGLVIFINFIYFFPLYTGNVITYNSWQARMWLPSWV